jgi:hypothetical protein
VSDRLSMALVNRYNLALSAGAVAASFGLLTPLFAASLALGALLETMSFRSLWRFCERAFFPSGGAGGAGPALGAFGVRFILLGAAIYVALSVGFHPIGLVAGLSLIVPALLLAAWRMRPTPPPVEGEITPPDDPVWDLWDPWWARERPPEDEEDEA